MKQDIQAVFFDAGYTLLCMDPDQQTLFSRVCAELNVAIDESKLASAVERANVLLAPRAPHQVPKSFSQVIVDRFWIEYNALVLTWCCANPNDIDRAELVYRSFAQAITWRIYDEVRPVLKTLRARGVCLGIISNWGGDLEEILQKMQLRVEFDFVLDSARLGCEKPHAEIFLEALRRSGARCDRALHVGDSPEHDVDGALASGLRAVLLDRAGRYPEFTRAPRVSTLEGLLAHL